MTMLRRLVWLDLKLFLREPLTLVLTLAFPPLVLVVLGAVFGDEPPDPQHWEGLAPMDIYVPGYIALTLASVGVLTIPVHLTTYRETGVLRRLQASPIGLGVTVAAEALAAVVVATVGAVLLLVLGALAYDVHLPRAPWLVLVTYALSALCFCAIGFLLGVLLPNARAAQGLGLLLFFVMMFLSGTDGPRELFGSTLHAVSDTLPMTHMVLAMVDPWTGRGMDWAATAIVVGFTLAAVAGSALAVRGRPRVRRALRQTRTTENRPRP
jgi:ABC-2 type transport system permease protein